MEVVLTGLHGLNYFNQKFKRRYEVGMICDWESPGESWRESTKWLGSRHIVSKVKTITKVIFKKILKLVCFILNHSTQIFWLCDPRQLAPPLSVPCPLLNSH